MKSLITQGTSLLKKASEIKAPPTAALDSFRMLLDAHHNYKKTVQVETTKREAITAWRDVRLKDLENRRAVLESYLTHSFAERHDLIQGFFERLDRGIDEGNDHLISEALSGIVAIAKQSPLADVEKLIGDMNDDSVKCIEI